MDQRVKKFSETVADIYATKFLTDNLGGEVFLGGEIEQILADHAYIVYQSVDDLHYFGAALHLAGKHIIAINTKQVLRTRFYSAAHELWHLQFESGEIDVDGTQIDQERAADHFAAVIMLPRTLVKNFINNFKGTDEQLILKIADLSAMPYQAVARRLEELGHKIAKDLRTRKEIEWVQARSLLGFVPSTFDKADEFIQFNALSQEIERKLENQEITLELAANLIKHIDSKQAEEYWRQRNQITDDWELEDD